MMQIHHKEENKSRVKTDQTDRLSLRRTLDVCIDPLENESHPDGALMNIVTGEVAHPTVNADNAVGYGKQAMETFKAGWPGSFYDPLAKLIITMDVKKKHILVGKERVYDQELIYACVIGLLISSCSINIDQVLECE